MTTHVRVGSVPQITLGWRLRLALGDMHMQEMADTLGVDRTTISRWINDRGAPPRRAYMAQWALATGVDLDWLTTGIAPADDDDDGNRDTNAAPARANARTPRSSHALLAA